MEVTCNLVGVYKVNIKKKIERKTVGAIGKEFVMIETKTGTTILEVCGKAKTPETRTRINAKMRKTEEGKTICA